MNVWNKVSDRTRPWGQGVSAKPGKVRPYRSPITLRCISGMKGTASDR